MNNLLIHPTYFPSISHFVAISQADSITFEMEDNFQKQTNRNRMYIYSPNGIQLLNIPIKHSKEAHQRTKDVKLETAFDWQKQHFKSLEAAYRTSPFFEYFEDEIYPIFTKKHTFLMDLNLESMETVDNYMLRHKVIPGITGLAQVNGCRVETKTTEDMQRRVNFDLYYIQRWNFWLDLQIIIQTVINIFRGDQNAY
jgi:hypothetical protein